MNDVSRAGTFSLNIVFIFLQYIFDVLKSVIQCSLKTFSNCSILSPKFKELFPFGHDLFFPKS